MIAHPPCTYLAVSGVQYWSRRTREQEEALEFVRLLLDAPVPRIAVENPVGCLSTKLRMPDQVINPWQFGHSVNKRTCLWLKNLPLLEPTEVVQTREPFSRNLSPTPFRGQIRSITFRGIAKAMAEQWGSLTEYYPPSLARIREYHNVMPQVKHTVRKEFTVL